jgi:hypothetical protein
MRDVPKFRALDDLFVEGPFSFSTYREALRGLSGVRF